MDSSIAPHLRRPRTHPTRKGDAFQPPYPSFSARFPTTTTRVVMAYYGVQWDSEEPPAAVDPMLRELTTALRATDGARHVDFAAYTDELGYRTRVVIAYWDDPSAFERWGAGDTWLREDRDADGIGVFAEVVRPPVDRFETLFSSQRLEGVSELSDGFSDEVREHAYWGGARDRMPAAQDDPLDPAGSPSLQVAGRLRTVRLGDNACLIRSGQEWTETEGTERAMYVDDVEPHLRAGMDYLRDEGRDIGCFVNRYMTVTDEDWVPGDKTFGASWWVSLRDLDTWAESHPTHLAIFVAAMKYLSTMGPAAKLRLFHEVTVSRAGDATFSYLDCHDSTGMLRAVLPASSSSVRTSQADR